MINQRYEIEISDQQNLLDLDPNTLRNVAERLLDAEQVTSATISLAFVDDSHIHQINRDFLQHDYPTDVISFLLNERQVSPTDNHETVPRGFGQKLEGEVIVSTETAVREAENFDWPPEEETVLYVIHGLLHLVGYDDLSDDERVLMRRREREILTLCGIETPTTTMEEPPGDPDLPAEHTLRQEGERS